MTSAEKPTLRWGIVATGLISFLAQDFASRQLPQASPPPTLYEGYEGVYADKDVEIVYIGTPHGFHKKNCLDAIGHGKHVLCEKTFTLNVSEAREVFEAAKSKGVFVMEAMWTRFFPLVKSVQKLVHEDKAIGHVCRVLCDFAMDQGLDSKGPESRLKNLSLGASSLLDIGIYSLTWAMIGLEQPLGSSHQEASKKLRLLAISTLRDNVDIATSIILDYDDGRVGVATSHSATAIKTPSSFCRIEGSEGTIVVDGFYTSMPSSFVLQKFGMEDERFEFEKTGRGFYWEADAVALDIAAGRTENETMPWAETIRVMELLDEARRQGGNLFPQDDQ